MGNFKEFLINESKSILGSRIGDILTATNDLEEDFDNMSPRQLIRVAESIVNQIRRVVHGQWNSDSFKHLKKLQAIGVAIMKTVDEKGDVKQVLRQTGEELSRLTKALGVKINHIDVSKGEEEQSPDMQLTGQDQPPKKPQPQQPQMSMDDLASGGQMDQMSPPLSDPGGQPALS